VLRHLGAMVVNAAASSVSPRRSSGCFSVLPVAAFFCIAQLLVAAEGKASRPRQTYRSSRHHDNNSFWPVLAAIGLLFLLCTWGICWCLYLDSKPLTRTTRRCMLLTLFCAAVIDSGACAHRYFNWWLLPVSIIVNLWGPFDAIKRFPIVHGFETFFPWKQLMLLVVKCIAYLVSFSSNAPSQMVLLAVMVLNLMVLPLMYVFALPMDFDLRGEQAIAAREVVDVDVALQVFQFCRDPRSRRQTAMAWQRHLRIWAVRFAQVCPAASKVLGHVDPDLRRSLKKTGRVV